MSKPRGKYTKIPPEFIKVATHICEYGCGQPAHWRVTNQRRWCCSQAHPTCPAVIERKRQSNLAKYGVETHMQRADVREKSKQTNLERYGVVNPFQAEGFQEKRSSTMIERYGVEHNMQSEVFREMARRTCQQRYGAENAMQSEIMKAKVDQTCMERYGLKRATALHEVQEKMKATSRERYGFDYAMQNSEVAERILMNGFQYREHQTPSGKAIRVQGYEDWAYDSLLGNEIPEEDIFWRRSDMPEIWYELDGRRRYYPDFFIPSRNMVVEVKSEYTYLLSLAANKAKHVATEAAGYEFRLLMFNARGEMITVDDIHAIATAKDA
jgi:hypothetical protein